METTDVVSFTFNFLTTAKSKMSDIEEENSPVVNNGESPNGKQEGTPQAIQIDLKEYIGQTLKELLKEGISMPGKDEKSSSHKRKKSESDDEEGEINPPKKNPTQKQSHSESEATSGVEIQVRAEKDDIDMFLASESEGEEENDDGDKSDDDGWLAEMAELIPKDETGEEVAPEVADITTKILASRQNNDKLKTLWEKYPKPGNAGLLVTPRTNDLVFKKLKRGTRWEEIEANKLGDRMAKSLIGNVVTLDKITKLKENCKDKELKKALKDVARSSLETLKMGAAAMHKLSDVRRFRIKNDLHAYKALCDTPEEESADLLGANIADKMREINEAAKMERQLSEGNRPFYKKERYHQTQSKFVARPCDNEPHRQMEANDGKFTVYRPRPERELPEGECATKKQQLSRQPVIQAKRKLQGETQETINKVRNYDENWECFKKETISLGSYNATHFQAGNLREHVKFWKSLTTDPNIIAMITGTDIELEEEIRQTEAPEPYRFPQAKVEKIQGEITKLLNKGVIVKAHRSNLGIVSNIFTREKPDGSLRIILDLSDFNSNVTYRHFKMENLASAINLMTTNCYMASIDWKDAYYSVPIAKSSQKYLQFEWKGQLYNYTCYPNGLSSAPRNFTKITKVLFAELRKKGYLSTNYIDDCLLLAPTKEECKRNVRATVQMSENAGFVVHPEKSQLEPKTKIEYLGFQLDSRLMNVRLTESKANKIKVAVENILAKKSLSIRQLSQIVGSLVASFPGVKYGQLFYRSCDNFKTKTLKESRGNFEAKISLPTECRSDLQWWVENIKVVDKPIRMGKTKYTLESDASKSGWGGCLVNGGDPQKTGGNWNRVESERHINYLELLAAWLTIQSFCKNERDCNIKVLSDNTTTVAYLNNMGGTKDACNRLAREIWYWCYLNNNWITSTHLPGKINTVADKESRSVHDNMEWKLHPELFKTVCAKWGTPDIDLFASRLNCQLVPYCSWKPDPGAKAVDAMSIDWSIYFFYAFPPFNMMGRVLRKVEEEQAEGVIIFPAWPTQTWYPKLLSMCINEPLVLYRKNATLSHPWRMEETLPKTRIMAARISAKASTT